MNKKTYSKRNFLIFYFVLTIIFKTYRRMNIKGRRRYVPFEKLSIKDKICQKIVSTFTIDLYPEVKNIFLRMRKPNDLSLVSEIPFTTMDNIKRQQKNNKKRK